MPATRKILVTAALPYANNALHIGHMVEYVQTDIWARFQRLRGHEIYFCCASDAHGTPTMLKAEEENTTPEKLLDRVYREHRSDFEQFGISVDNYRTTHAPENHELTAELYRRLLANGFINRRTIQQAYDVQRGMFLPDRYVRGTCPNCGTPDQYGDSCEVCSAAYTPLDLKDAVSTLSGTAPAVKESEHIFFELGKFADEVREWIHSHVDQGVARKLEEWFEAGLQDWDISRDAPYFGFEIPEESEKFFYVWFDAVIGYMSSFLNYCRSNDLSFDEFWGKDSDAELYHFIGKDIIYFHCIYWPAMLIGAEFRTPSGVFAHGFLTVDGQKMSKRRGTFILAKEFASKVDPEYLRYYFASKLGPAPEDIDLNLADFVAKVNSDLVGKYVNIASRCAGFIHKLGNGRLSDKLPDDALYQRFVAEGESIAADYESRNYSRAVRSIMALADEANRYIDEHKPWIMAKESDNRDAVVDVCTQGINLFRALSVYLKPLVPDLCARVESFLGQGELVWQDVSTPLTGCEIGKFSSLLKRLELKEVEAMVSGNQPPAETPSDEDEFITIDQFAAIDLRVAKIVEADYVEGADKLLAIQLDVGDSQRRVFSGIRKSYEPEKLVGRHVILVANLKPRKMRFGVSEGMILAAGGDQGIFLLDIDAGAKPGMKVT